MHQVSKGVQTAFNHLIVDHFLESTFKFSQCHQTGTPNLQLHQLLVQLRICGENQLLQYLLTSKIYLDNKIYNTSTLVRMGYNSKCIDQNCSAGCCNTYGRCPSTSYTATTLSRTCKYYYSQSSSTSNSPLSGGAIAGIAIAPIVFLVVLIVGIICCIKKCQQNQIQKMQAQRANNQTLQTGTNPTLNMTTQHLGTEYTDPNQVMLQNQPFYGQPYVQPLGNFSGPPQMMNPQVPPVYGNPEQAIFGQGPMNFDQPPMNYGQPSLSPNPPGYPNYGPGPIVR